MNEIWTPAQEAERLRARFADINKAAFARDNKVPGGASMISQHISGHRPMSLAAATAYAIGFGVPLSEISPRLAAEVDAASLTQEQSNVAPASSTSSPVSLAQALEVVARSLNDLPDAQRDLAAQHLQTLARAPDSAKAMQALLAALHCDVPPMPLPESRDFQPPVPPSFLLKNKTTEHHS